MCRRQARERELETWPSVGPSSHPNRYKFLAHDQSDNPSTQAGQRFLALQPSRPAQAHTMADTSKATSEESFEFIKTPPTSTPQPAENYGVRTTNVSTPQTPNTPLPSHWLLKLTSAVVPDHQERSSARRWPRQRQLQQQHPVRSARRHPAVLYLQGRRWHQDMDLLRHPDRHPHPDGLLDRRLDLWPA